MKTYKTLLKAAVICAALLTAPMFAQNVSNVSGTSVDVPFAFRIGQQTLPPGHYTLKASAGSGLMLVGDAAGHTTITLTSLDNAPAVVDSPRVVFRVYGATRFLSGVKIPGATSFSLPQSPAEREFAGSGKPVEVAVLTGRR